MFTSISSAQLSLRDLVIIGGDGSCPNGPNQTPPSGCGVFISSSAIVRSGSVSSYSFIKTNSDVIINGNIHSGGRADLGNNNNIGGIITVANSSSQSGSALLIGNNAILNGNIDVAGNINIGSSQVNGKVTHPSGTTYTGPVPKGGEVIDNPSIPALPQMPAITNFPSAGTKDITNSGAITPDKPYRNVKLNGNKTLTFSGPGTYVFNSIKNTGSINKLVFDFQDSPTGIIKIYVHGDVDLEVFRE